MLRHECNTDGRIKRGLEEGVWSLSAILLSAERESERRSRVRKSKAAAIRSSSDDERGEARRVWFRVDRGESQCIAPVGATSWLRAFVVTRGRTPVADSAESCTTWEERASEEGTEGEGEGRRVGETGHFVAATQLLFLVTAKLRFVSRQLPKDRGKFNGTSSNHPPLETISIRF